MENHLQDVARAAYGKPLKNYSPGHEVIIYLRQTSARNLSNRKPSRDYLTFAWVLSAPPYRPSSWDSVCILEAIWKYKYLWYPLLGGAKWRYPGPISIRKEPFRWRVDGLLLRLVFDDSSLLRAPTFWASWNYTNLVVRKHANCWGINLQYQTCRGNSTMAPIGLMARAFKTDARSIFDYANNGYINKTSVFIFFGPNCPISQISDPIQSLRII